MRYTFPQATHIDAYLAAIEGYDEFVAKRDPDSGLIILNYVFAQQRTFEDPLSFEDPQAQLNAALRRECRGIEFDMETGDLVTRKFAKFFNIGEKPETSSHIVPWDQQHWVLEKLDGSMITPYRRRDGRYEWHTKMGMTDVARPVMRHVAAFGPAYEFFAEAMCEQGKTPIFEWCSRQQRIVIDYPVDELVLTAIRDIRTGAYTAYPEMAMLAGLHGIPCVKALEGGVGDVQKFLRESADIEGMEGYIIRWADGHMVKAKGAWYTTIHRTKDMLHLEKDVWSLVLDELVDDAKPFMQTEDLAAVEGFVDALFAGAKATADRIDQVVAAAKQSCAGEKKRFATEVVPAFPSVEKALLFAVWDGKPATEAVLGLLKKNTGSQTRIDEIRYLAGGVSWSHFYGAGTIDG